MRATWDCSLRTKYRQVAVRASLKAEAASLIRVSTSVTFGIRANESEFTSWWNARVLNISESSSFLNSERIWLCSAAISRSVEM